MPNCGSEDVEPADGGPPSRESRRALSTSTPGGPSRSRSRSRKSRTGDRALPTGERRERKSLESLQSRSLSRSRSRSRLLSSRYLSRYSISLSRPRSLESSRAGQARPRPRPLLTLKSPAKPPPRGPLGGSTRALGPRGGSLRIESPKESRLAWKPDEVDLASADERRLSPSPYWELLSNRSGERSLGDRDRRSGSYLEYLEALKGG